MKKAVILLLLLSCSLLLYSQDYMHSIGIRAGLSSGIEYRQYLDRENSVKLLLSTRQRGLQLHGLYEFHNLNLFPESDLLHFFYGVGVHAGYERWNEYHPAGQNTYTEVRTGVLAGIDGLLGTEYNFSEIPLSAGVEGKPFIDLGGQKGLSIIPWDFALTVKYLF